MFAYISSSLTGLTDEEREKYLPFYDELAAVCLRFGLASYVPHHYGDPIKFPNLTPQQVDEIDRRAVTLSALVVAYIGLASTGAGIEIELAHHADKPVILLWEKGHKVSRLPKGAPAAIASIEFTDFEDAKHQLGFALAQLQEREARKDWMPELLRIFQSVRT